MGADMDKFDVIGLICLCVLFWMLVLDSLGLLR